jgi:DNA adenine methylase
MTDGDHRSLAVALHGILGMVMLSGYGCQLYEELYAGWERVERRHLADGAKPRVECLWFNPAAWERRPQGQLYDQQSEIKAVS